MRRPRASGLLRRPRSALPLVVDAVIGKVVEEADLLEAGEQRVEIGLLRHRRLNVELRDAERAAEAERLARHMRELGDHLVGFIGALIVELRRLLPHLHRGRRPLRIRIDPVLAGVGAEIPHRRGRLHLEMLADAVVHVADQMIALRQQARQCGIEQQAGIGLLSEQLGLHGGWRRIDHVQVLARIQPILFQKQNGHAVEARAGGGGDRFAFEIPRLADGRILGNETMIGGRDGEQQLQRHAADIEVRAIVDRAEDVAGARGREIRIKRRRIAVEIDIEVESVLLVELELADDRDQE